MPPKTPKSKRIITLPAFLCDIIKEYAAKYYGIEPKDKLFPATKDSFHRAMKRGCEVTSIKKIRLHDLRHSHASLLIELGFSPLLISERLGYEKIETTLQIYSYLYPNKHEEVAMKLDSLK